MLRLTLVRRTLAAAVLVLLGSVLGAGTVHVHVHGTRGEACGGSVAGAGATQTLTSCVLCRFVQQPVAAGPVLARAGGPVTVAVTGEAALVQEPRQVAFKLALPRAPPVPSPIA